MYSEIIMIVSGLLLGSILAFRYKKITAGSSVPVQDGLLEFQGNTQELAIYLRKLYRYIRKTFVQYAFHSLVRVLYYLQLFFGTVYANARDKFMREAVKDRKAISRFWNTLKEYKQEIDEEKKK